MGRLHKIETGLNRLSVSFYIGHVAAAWPPPIGFGCGAESKGRRRQTYNLSFLHFQCGPLVHFGHVG